MNIFRNKCHDHGLEKHRKNSSAQFWLGGLEVHSGLMCNKTKGKESMERKEKESFMQERFLSETEVRKLPENLKE